MSNENTGVFIPADILIPKNKYDMTKWAVIACDQYTGEEEYWDKVRELTKGYPSAYNLMLPEVYLGASDESERLTCISETMREYLDEGIFDEYKDALIYVERTDSEGRVRKGLVGAIDLEEYDFSKDSHSKVRATEATIVERIPPRIKLRECACLEMPHIMLLIDDWKKTVIEEAGKEKNRYKKLYDFDLMQKGGSIKGWLLDEKAKAYVKDALEKLPHSDEKDALIFAVGDGNHSLATAKTYYENLKKADLEGKVTDAEREYIKYARYALCEVVNLHSPALEFEAIHRIVNGVDVDNLMAFLKEELGLKEEKQGEVISVSVKGTSTSYIITKPSHALTVGSLQNALDRYLNENEGSIDYIHGKENVRKMSEKDGSVAFILPDMKKEELFPSVKSAGVLPRKTFSMGHADDKRFYLETRRIK